MKIVSYNIQYGLGSDGKYNLKRIAEEIEEADIIALQEVDRYWKRSGELDQPEVISSFLPSHFYVYGANFDVHAGQLDKGRVVSNRRRQFGTMILSKSPILSSRNFPLPKFGAAHQHSIQQGILEAVIDTKVGPVRFYSVHLSHLASEIRMVQVRKILEIHKVAYGEGGAWCGGHPEPDSGWLEGTRPPMPSQAIILGDMNFDYRSPEYDAFTGPLSPEYGRVTHRLGFVDAWVASGKEEESGQSHPNNKYRIDHCFVCSDLSNHVQSVWVDNKAEGSDHWPLWVELDI